MRFIAAILITGLIGGCNESPSFKNKSKAEKLAEESREKNGIRKGRYECWHATDSNRTAALSFYILSNNMYQVYDQAGRYHFNPEENTLEFTDGPLATGEFSARYIAAPAYQKNDSTQEPLIEILDSGRRVMRCNCSIFMY
jgi:hypothetical protein